MELLPPESAREYAHILENVPFNILFARGVMEGLSGGSVYIDKAMTSSHTFYILHSIGMSLLVGDATNEQFNQALIAHWLTKDARDEYLQVCGSAWEEMILKLADQHPHFVVHHRRQNFRFDKDLFNERLTANQTSTLNSLAGVELKRINRESFHAVKWSAVPITSVWTEEDFFARGGVGFDLFKDGQIMCRAFSAWRFMSSHSNELELAIETVEAARKQGYAKMTCTKMIEYCLDNHLEPVWTCRAGNFASVKLAESLGFVPSMNVPYYQLKRSQQLP